MNVVAHLIIISVNMTENKTYIVSRKNEDNEFIFPELTVTNENKNVLEEILTNKVIMLTDGNEYESFPQIVSHHCVTVSDDDEQDRLNLIFGFLITTSQQIIKNEEFEWKEYIFTEVYKNQTIINNTLMRLK